MISSYLILVALVHKNLLQDDIFLEDCRKSGCYISQLICWRYKIHDDLCYQDSDNITSALNRFNERVVAEPVWVVEYLINGNALQGRMSRVERFEKLCTKIFGIRLRRNVATLVFMHVARNFAICRQRPGRLKERRDPLYHCSNCK